MGGTGRTGRQGWTTAQAWAAAGLPAGLVNVRQAAGAIGVSIETVRNWIRRGVIKAWRLPSGHGGNGAYMVDLAEMAREVRPDDPKPMHYGVAAAQRARRARERKRAATEGPELSGDAG